MHQEVIAVSTSGRGFVDVTRAIAEVVSRSGLHSGVCQTFLQHTSASLVIQENADPAVLRDLQAFFDELVPEQRAWEHDDEGPDDMPAHVKAALTKTQETMPIVAGRLGLGVWQALYVWEHRDCGHRRNLVVTLWGK